MEQSIIQVDYTPSSKNRADNLTNVLVGDDYFKQRAWLGVSSSAVIEGACQGKAASWDDDIQSPT